MLEVAWLILVMGQIVPAPVRETFFVGYRVTSLTEMFWMLSKRSGYYGKYQNIQYKTKSLESADEDRLPVLTNQQRNLSNQYR
jgi:hypothetical protein